MPFVNAKLFQIQLLKQQKRQFWNVIPLESLILRTFECTALSERDLCVRILEMRAEAMHGSISAVETKYCLQCPDLVCDWDGGCNAC